MCAPDHPQNIFCYTEYAAKVFIKSERTVTIDDDGNIEELIVPENNTDYYAFWDPMKATMTEYRIKILKVFKGDLKENTISSMYTPAFSFLCKHDLSIRHSYFIMGQRQDGRLNINLCNYVMDVTHESPNVVRQLTRNFRLRYPKTCGRCRICHHPMCYDAPVLMGCKWPQSVSLYNTLESTKYSCVPKDETACSLRYPFEKKLENGETTIIPSEVPEVVATTTMGTPPPLKPEDFEYYEEYDDEGEYDPYKEVQPEP